MVVEFDYPSFSRRFRAKPKFLVNDAKFEFARHGKTYVYEFGLLLPKTANVSRPRGHSAAFCNPQLSLRIVRLLKLA